MVLKLRVMLATGTKKSGILLVLHIIEIQKYYSIYSVICMKGDILIVIASNNSNFFFRCEVIIVSRII